MFGRSSNNRLSCEVRLWGSLGGGIPLAYRGTLRASRGNKGAVSVARFRVILAVSLADLRGALALPRPGCGALLHVLD